MITKSTAYRLQGSNTRWLGQDELVEYFSGEVQFSCEQNYDLENNLPNYLVVKVKQTITEDVLLVGFLLIAGLSFIVTGVVIGDVYYTFLGALGALGGLFHYLGK